MATTGSSLLAGRYDIGKPLGQGGMGRVWLARDSVLDRDVAVKEIVLPADLAAHERDSLQRRTLREARAAARLTHPNVAQVYDVFEVNGRPWIVMEHVPSRSLQEVVDADGPLEPAQVARIGLEVLTALQAAHQAGVRHRDVKPSNVLLADNGRVVLTDFGIAAIEGDGITTSADLVLGSPQFMAPERALRGESTPVSDLWSLGATLYAAVEGRSPYQRPSAMGTLMALAAEDPEPPRQAGVLQPVLDGLLRKDPAERIDAEEARRRLREAAGLKEEAAEDLRWNRPPVPDPAGVAAPAEVVPEPGDEPVLEPVVVPSAEPADPPAPRRRPPARLVVLVLVVLAVLAGAGIVAHFAITKGRGTRGPAVSGSGVSGSGGPGSGVSGSGVSGAGGNPQTSPGAPAAGSTTGSTGPGTSGATSTAPAPGPATSTAAGGSPATSRPALPAGWVDYHDRTGFSVYVPEGWTKSQEKSIVYFRSAGRVLGIDQSAHPNMDPVADWRGKADYRVAHGDFPGYREIHIQAVDYFVKAADWEFTFNGSNARQHVNNRGLVANDHQAYGIYWQTPDSQWRDAYPDLQLIFASFRARS